MEGLKRKAGKGEGEYKFKNKEKEIIITWIYKI